MIIDRPTISARFLLASPPPTETLIPEGFKITQCSARYAAGSRRRMAGGRDDAPQAVSVATIVRSCFDKRAVSAYAATSSLNRR